MTSRHSSILPANLLAPFANYEAFLRSNYSRASAPPHGPQPTTNLPPAELDTPPVGRP
jgi:hypothetical protein